MTKAAEAIATVRRLNSCIDDAMKSYDGSDGELRRLSNAVVGGFAVVRDALDALVPPPAAAVAGEAPRCYLQEDDPPHDHDLNRYGILCGRCHQAEVDSLEFILKVSHDALWLADIALAKVQSGEESYPLEGLRERMKGVMKQIFDAVEGRDCRRGVGGDGMSDEEVDAIAENLSDEQAERIMANVNLHLDKDATIDALRAENERLKGDRNEQHRWAMRLEAACDSLAKRCGWLPNADHVQLLETVGNKIDGLKQNLRVQFTRSFFNDTERAKAVAELEQLKSANPWRSADDPPREEDFDCNGNVVWRFKGGGCREAQVAIDTEWWTHTPLWKPKALPSAPDHSPDLAKMVPSAPLDLSTAVLVPTAACSHCGNPGSTEGRSSAKPEELCPMCGLVSWSGAAKELPKQ